MERGRPIDLDVMERPRRHPMRARVHACGADLTKDENVYVRPDGFERCRSCHRKDSRERYRRLTQRVR